MTFALKILKKNVPLKYIDCYLLLFYSSYHNKNGSTTIEIFLPLNYLLAKNMINMSYLGL